MRVLELEKSIVLTDLLCKGDLITLRAEKWLKVASQKRGVQGAQLVGFGLLRKRKRMAKAGGT